MLYDESERQKTIYYLPRNRMKSKTGLHLSKAIEGFMLTCQARHLSEHTIADYRRTLRKFISHVGDQPINKITIQNVEAFLACQPGKQKTILNYHIGLSALWTWALRENYVDRHIIRLIHRPDPQQVVIQPFSKVEIKAMLSSVKRNQDRDRSLIMFLLDTGLRASELIGLKLSDIDLVARRIKVLGKGNKERLIPFSPRTASTIFRYISSLDAVPETKIYPYTRNSLADLVRAIGDRAGVAGSHPHRFRHTFAVNYLKNGGDPFTLQDILGHTTMEMVKVYLHLAQVDIDLAHKRASPVEGWEL
jgi:integrase/recombinase XerD